MPTASPTASPTAGVRYLVVEIISSAGLRDADTFSSSDPYAVAYMPGLCPLAHFSSAACSTCSSCFKTRTVSDTQAPAWAETFAFPTAVAPDTDVVFKVLDDDTTHDDLLFTASVHTWGAPGSTRTLMQGSGSATLQVRLAW